MADLNKLPEAFVTAYSGDGKYFVEIKCATMADMDRWHDAVLAAYKASDEAGKLREAEVEAAMNKAREVLGFFASVIKSGEAWSIMCQNEYVAALRAVDELRLGPSDGGYVLTDRLHDAFKAIGVPLDIRNDQFDKLRELHAALTAAKTARKI